MPTYPPITVPENTAQGIPGGNANAFQVGINDIDPGGALTNITALPWASTPELSWLDYGCWLETRLDPGIVTHCPMPQSKQEWDQLGTATPNSAEFVKSKTGGPNLVSKGNWTGTVQRMANSRYRVLLKGYAVRIGYEPPIPRLESIGGVDAIPDGEQVVDGPRIIGNYGGVPIYVATWVIPYTTSIPPKKNQAPPANLAEHIAATPVADLPAGMEVPLSGPDASSVRSGPEPRINLLTGITQ